MTYPPYPTRPQLAHPFVAPRTSGMSIVSLVCGIIICIPLASIAAVVTGIIGLKQTNDPNVRGRGMAIAGIVLGGIGTVFGTLMWIVMIPVIAIGLTGFECRSNLDTVGKALQQYARTNGGQLPSDLNVLVANGLLASGDVICPRAKTPYIFTAAGQNLNALPATAILVDEPVTNHRTTARHALFANGKVKLTRTGSPTPPAAMPMTSAAPSPSPTTSPTTARGSPRVTFDREQLIGTWVSSAAGIEHGKLGFAKVTFRKNGTFEYDAPIADNPIHLRGTWTLTGLSVKLDPVPERSGAPARAIQWRIGGIGDRELIVHVHMDDEVWRKQ